MAPSASGGLPVDDGPDAHLHPLVPGPKGCRPGRATSELTNRRAMNVVEEQVLNGPGWLLRSQDVSDVGVDAHVEVVDEHGDPTGRLLCLQVKGGASRFDEPCAEGWVFRFSEEHARYWLGHALPVVLVLVDVDARCAHWQLLTAETVVSTGTRCKTVVPRSQVVARAGPEWEHLASAAAAQAPGRWPEVLQVLPPGCVRRLRALHAVRPRDAEVLACHLADGRTVPQRTAEVLLDTAPVWLTRCGPAGWRALAAFAAEHDRPVLSGRALVEAAAPAPSDGAADEDGAVDERADVLALAAMHFLVGGEEGRADTCIAEARRLRAESPRVVVVSAVVDHGLRDAAPVGLPASLLREVSEGSPRTAADPVVQTVVGEVAARQGDLDEAGRRRTAAAGLQRRGGGGRPPGRPGRGRPAPDCRRGPPGR